MKKKLIRVSAKQVATAYTLTLSPIFAIYLLAGIVMTLISGQSEGLWILLVAMVFILGFNWVFFAILVWIANKVLKKMGGIEYETIDSPVTPMQ